MYGPLHTAVEAVPPPKIATASDRLGLEPLRSLSDAKKLNQKVALITKPILKYRSLSDILLQPGGSPASPILEAFTGQQSMTPEEIIHAKSDSNLARLNREANRKRSASPHIPSGRGGGQDSSSEEPALSDSSSTSGVTATTRTGERRHISFNHRVEQCIAVDALGDDGNGSANASNGNESSGSEDGDDEDDVLTFRSSSRAAQIANLRRRSTKELTIYRLGPTTLKSSELYPSPSPVVVYPSHPDDPQQSSYGQPVATYTSRPTTTVASQNAAKKNATYDYTNMNPQQSSQWEEDDEDYAMGFDYFNGPDVGVGDEYDMAQYGSTHLVGGSHNDYVAGSVPYGPYSGNPTSPRYAPDDGNLRSNSNSGSGSNSPSVNGGSGAPSPVHSRQSSVRDDTIIIAAPSPPLRGPHAPPTSSKDSFAPKRSILKARSRQNSDNSDDIQIGSAQFGSSPSPDTSVPPSPISSSPQSSSPHNSSASSLAAVMASAGIPSVTYLRDSSGGVRRVDSTELVREARGRSTSRGSSSSLERSASADRRTSSSISPSSSYSPPALVGSATTASSSSTSLAPPRSTQLGGPRRGSSDSLISLGGAMGNRELMPDVPEASSESEAETVRAVDGIDEDEVVERVMVRQAGVGFSADFETAKYGDTLVDDDGFPSDLVDQEEEDDETERMDLPVADVAPPSPPVVHHLPVIAGMPMPLAGALRYRHPSPSAPKTVTASLSNDAFDSEGSPTISIEDVDALDTPPIEDDTPVTATAAAAPSSARRSLLRASRGGGHISSSTEREGSLGGSRSSIESGRGANSGTHDDSYGFGYYDEDSDGGIVSRTLEVAGTVRDLWGALSRGILWRRDTPSTTSPPRR